MLCNIRDRKASDTFITWWKQLINQLIESKQTLSVIWSSCQADFDVLGSKPPAGWTCEAGNTLQAHVLAGTAPGVDKERHAVITALIFSSVTNVFLALTAAHSCSESTAVRGWCWTWQPEWRHVLLFDWQLNVSFCSWTRVIWTEEDTDRVQADADKHEQRGCSSSFSPHSLLFTSSLTLLLSLQSFLLLTPTLSQSFISVDRWCQFLSLPTLHVSSVFCTTLVFTWSYSNRMVTVRQQEHFLWNPVSRLNTLI